MSGSATVADRILQFNEHLAQVELDLPPGFRAVNPFTGPQGDRVREVTTGFYRRYFDDDRPRKLILGSSPARRGTAVTGVPFEDAKLLEGDTGVDVSGGYAVSRRSAGFLHDVIARYGGRPRFYADFVMSFVCPLGLVKTKQDREANANYYDTRELLKRLEGFLVDTLERQLEFGADTSVCYCIGSSGNFDFLTKVNADRAFFKEIVPLEHPRYITQYNGGRSEEFAEKYLRALRGEGD